jgi:putative transposase
MRRAIRVRVYPDEAQNDVLVAQWGAVRFVWNKALWAMSHAWRTHGVSLDPKHDLKKVLVVAKKSRRYGWLADHDSMALQQALINLGKARTSFFKGQTKYPKFKSRYDHQSSYHCSGRIGWGVDGCAHLKGNGWITIPKMPGQIRACIHRDIPEDWDLKSITMKRTKTHKVYATLLFETNQAVPALPKVIDEDGVEGHDLGLTAYLTNARGDKTANPRHVRKATARVRRRSKSLTRKKKGSSNRGKARVQLARAHEDLANARSDFLHKLSRKCVDENQANALETLRVRNMMKNRKLARAIGDTGWGEFARQVDYKSAWAGKLFIKIDPFAPSTKTCSSCLVKNDTLTLKDRTWVCNCGAVHDRDVNAAINIRRLAILDLRAKGYVVRSKGKAPGGRMSLETV